MRRREVERCGYVMWCRRSSAYSRQSWAPYQLRIIRSWRQCPWLFAGRASAEEDLLQEVVVAQPSLGADTGVVAAEVDEKRDDVQWLR